MARSLRSGDKASQRTPSMEPQPTGRVLRSSSQQLANDKPAELPTSNSGKVRKQRSKSASSSAPSSPPSKRKQPKRAGKATAVEKPSTIPEEPESEEPASTNTASSQEAVVEVGEATVATEPAEHDVDTTASKIVVESEVVTETTTTNVETKGMNDETVSESHHETKQVATVDVAVDQVASSSEPEEAGESVLGTASGQQSESEQEQDIVHQSIEEADEEVTVEEVKVPQTYIQPCKAPEQSSSGDLAPFLDPPTTSGTSPSAIHTDELVSSAVTPPGELVHVRAPGSLIPKTSTFIKDQYVQSRLPVALPKGLSNWVGLDYPTPFRTANHKHRDAKAMWAIAEGLTNVERTAIMVEQFGRIKELEEANRRHVTAQRERIAREHNVRNLDGAADEGSQHIPRPFDAKERYKRLSEREDSLKRKREEEDYQKEKQQKIQVAAAVAEAKRTRLAARVSGKDIIIAGAHSQREVDILTKMLVSKADGNYSAAMMQTYRNLLDNSTYMDKEEIDKIHIDWKWGNWPYSQQELDDTREEWRRKGWPIELPQKTFDHGPDPDLSTIEEGEENEDLPRSPKKARTSLSLNDDDPTTPRGLPSSPFQGNAAEDEEPGPQGWTGSLRNVIGSVRKYIPTFSRTAPKTAPVRRSRPMVNRTPIANIHDTARVPQQRDFTFATSPATPTVGRGRRESETARNTLANAGSPTVGRYPTESPAPMAHQAATSHQPETPRHTVQETDINMSETPGGQDEHENTEAPHTAPSKNTQNATTTQAGSRTAPPRRRLGPAAHKARQDRLERERLANKEQARKDARAAELARIDAARIRSEEAERLQQTGDKRKATGQKTRGSEARAADGGIGMPDDFYNSDSDEESMVADHGNRHLFNKRPRINHTPTDNGRKEAVEAFAGVFSTPGRSKSFLTEDPFKPAPYMGTMFASAKDVDTSANVFMKQQTIQDKNAQMEDSELSPRSFGLKHGVWTGPKEKVKKSESTFAVPESSDEESSSDDESSSEQATPKATVVPVATAPASSTPNFFAPATPSPSTPNIFAQSAGIATSTPQTVEPAVPTTPKIPHATLPTDVVEHDTTEALARARAAVEKYRPKTPSGLRMADRIASSPVTSSEQLGTPQAAPNTVSKHGDTPKERPETPPEVWAGDDAAFWEGFEFPKPNRLPTPGPEAQAMIDDFWANTPKEEIDRLREAEWEEAWRLRPDQ